MLYRSDQICGLQWLSKERQSGIERVDYEQIPQLLSPVTRQISMANTGDPRRLSIFIYINYNYREILFFFYEVLNSAGQFSTPHQDRPHSLLSKV